MNRSPPSLDLPRRARIVRACVRDDLYLSVGVHAREGRRIRRLQKAGPIRIFSVRSSEYNLGKIKQGTSCLPPIRSSLSGRHEQPAPRRAGWSSVAVTDNKYNRTGVLFGVTVGDYIFTRNRTPEFDPLAVYDE